ncbi:MAG: efflux RND transporter periplasmic adaptor subunit [Cyanobacteria bacterium P01_A01_bin.114]
MNSETSSRGHRTTGVGPAVRAEADLSASAGSALAGALVMPSKRKLHWYGLLFVMLIGGAVFAIARAKGTDTPEVALPPILPVKTQTLESVDAYRINRTYTGEIVAQRSSDLGFEQPGTLVEIRVDEGDWVDAGTPLARLDIRSLQAQRQQIEAQRRQALARFQELQQGPRAEDIAAAQAAVQDLQAQVELARLQQQRRENLYAQGAISREELDERAFSADALANRLQQAQSQLEELQTGTRVEQITAQDAQVEQFDASLQGIDVSLSKSTLYAPFSGRVAKRLVDEGVVIGPGQTVLRLVEGSTLEARIGVPANVANRLTLNTPQSIQVNNRVYPATVTALLPELDSTSQTVTVVLTLENAAEPTIGATARLALEETQPEAGYWLPTNALIEGERGLWTAYVLDELDSATPAAATPADTHKVARRDVEVLYTEGDRTFVRGMLQPGETVITSGIHRIVPGQRVKATAP